MTAQPRTTVIRIRRLPLALYSVAIAALLAGSAWLLTRPSSATDDNQAWTAWFGIVLFGSLTAAAVVRLILPPRLVFTPEGVWRYGSLGKGKLYRWADIRRFYLWRAPDRIGILGVTRSTPVAAFDYEPGREPEGVGAIFGRAVDLPPGFFGDWDMTPDALVQRLTERHRAAEPYRYDEAGRPKPLMGDDLTYTPRG